MKILHLDKNHPLLIEGLEKAGFSNVLEYHISKSEVLKIIHKYDGIIIRSRFSLDSKILLKAKNLKFIGRVGAGTENIDVEFATANNIIVINAPEGNKTAVAEHTLGMLLALMNKLMYSHQNIKNGIWKREISRGFELKGKTLGIIGYGNMGKSFAQKLIGLKCNVIFYDIKKNIGDKFARQVDIETLKKQADILSLHIPETKLTSGLIDSNFILSMKKSFWFLNTGRGKCVVTKDLLRFLKNGKIIGAALDVIEYESSSFSSIWRNTDDSRTINELANLDNVILSPHVAGSTYESQEKLAIVTLNKILDKFN